LRRVALCLSLILLLIPPLFAGEVLLEAKTAAETIRQPRTIGIPSTEAEKPMPPGQVPALLRTFWKDVAGWLEACKRAGVSYRWHDLRHTFVTRLAERSDICSLLPSMSAIRCFSTIPISGRGALTRIDSGK